MTELYITGGPYQGHSFTLRKDKVTLGRSSENDIQIKDNSISRKHLKIFREGNKYFIEDLKSKNGTLLRGERIEPGQVVEIEKGCPIRLGRTTVCLGEPISEHITGSFSSRDTRELGDFDDTGSFLRDRPGTPYRNMELVFKVSSVLMQSLNTQEILEKVLDYIFELFKRIERGAILLLNRETGNLEQIIARSRFESGNTTLPYSRTVVNRVVKEGKPLAMPDVSDEDPEEVSDSMGRIRSIMCVPLISRSQILGVIYVDSVSTPHGFRKEDLHLFTTLSSPAAIAIENALLYSDLEKRVEERTRSLRAVERKLRESEARFKAIFDNMSSGVMVLRSLREGKDFQILDLNRAARKIEGARKRDLLGRKVLETFPEYENARLLDVLKRVWKTGTPEDCSVTLLQRSEGPSWREYYVYRLPTEEIVAIYDDVTQKKQAEEEQRVLQEKLLASQKMQSIGALAGGTAHYFRNILQAISGNIEYLEMKYGKMPEVEEVSRSIYDSVEKGVDLINNLLRFSQKGEQIQLVDVDLSDVLTKTVEIMERVFNKNIEIVMNVEKNLIVKGNHALLSQVFTNLFTNARDAMPNGGRLLIEARREEEKAVALVADTGCGMDEDTLEKIFDPFVTFKEVGKGTGLGLSSSHGIIQQHKGSISVWSKPGLGTTFKIHLPLARSPKEQSPRVEREIIRGKGEKVLIVDDEPLALDAVSNLVASLGYKPIPVNRSVEAVRYYEQCKPDLVIMDRMMPEMDGIACIREIIKIDPKARIVIVSGYDEADLNGLDETVKGLIKGYLIKPCSLGKLSRALSQALGI